jgi:hypothetical protein
MLKRIIATALAAFALAGASIAVADTMDDPNSTEARNKVLNGYTN